MAVTALVLPVSGPYLGYWNGFTLGTMNDDGFVLKATYQGQEVNLSDVYGMTLVEAIYRGTNWRMGMRGLEFAKAGMLSAVQAFGASGDRTNSFTPVLVSVGDRYSLAAQLLLLVAVLPAVPTFPQILSAAGAVPAPQSSVELLMTSKVREVPMEMVLLPYYTLVGASFENLAFITS